MSRGFQSPSTASSGPAQQSSPAVEGGASNAAQNAALQQAGPATVVVEAGDTLWGIAARELADGSRWDELADLNDIDNPSLIHPGQELKLPVSAAPEVAAASTETTAAVETAQVLETAPADAPVVARTELGTEPSTAEEDSLAVEAGAGTSWWDRVKGAVSGAVKAVTGFFSGLFGRSSTPETTTPETPAPTVGTPAPTVATPAPTVDTPAPTVDTPAPTVETPKVEEPVAPEPEPVFHTVYPGDNLWSIAQQYLGDGNRWREIADANGLANPSLLKVGQKLTIPGASQAPITTPVPQPRPETVDRPDGPGTPDENGDSMGATDPISLEGLRGLNHTMASIYNTKGRYLKTKASSLGISTAAAAAVLKCESGGEGFHRESGDMIVRFENHIFWDQWGKNDPTTFHKHFQYASSKRWTGHQFRASETDAWMSFHGNQSKEWTVLDFARSLDDTAALKSISMGAAQIMGFNYQTLGYQSVQDMFESMAGSLPSQLDGMFAFIQANRTCMAGLQSGDYTQFARGYNGSGQAETYGALIRDAAAAYSRVTAGRAHA